MTTPVPEILGVGEILWDLLASGPQLGGAPFNFAFHCHQLGHAAAMVSRVGTDERGAAIHAAVRRMGLTDDFLQDDASHPTGTVAVSVDERGQPTFTITPAVAYDYLAWDPRLESLVRQVRAICFGTLIQRHSCARETIQRLVRAADTALIVYDVNLRQHFFSREIVEASLHACRWVKLNDHELVVLRDLLGLMGENEPALVADLRRRYRVELACLTRGENGAIVQTDAEEIVVPGLPVLVVDTIGAGDAFTAGLVCGVLEGLGIGAAALFANRLAARVAAAPGGTPLLGRDELAALRAM